MLAFGQSRLEGFCLEDATRTRSHAPTHETPAGRPVRIGCGAGFASDRIEPGVDLAERGELDFLFFECLAERTLAHSHLARNRDPAAGFNPHLARRMRAVLPACRANGTRIVTNGGAANPRGAGEAVAAVARELGLAGLKIAVVEGDDVSALIDRDTHLIEAGLSLGEFDRRVVGANAYLGSDAVADALDLDADIVITGRCADPALVLGPLIHAFGWDRSDWGLMGAGTLIGHLLECSAQVTGGYFADPGIKDVANLAFLGFPMAIVDGTGTGTITKLPGTGGQVTRETVLEQLFYEIHDPRTYLTPDVTADFSRVTIDELAMDRVQVSGAGGRERPSHLKATVGFDGGFLAEAEIGYAGTGAGARARLAAAILQERMTKLHHAPNVRTDLVGVDSLHKTALDRDGAAAESRDVRMRAALRTDDKELAETLLYEVEALWIAGPAGGGGMRGTITPSVTTQSVMIDRARIEPKIRMIVA